MQELNLFCLLPGDKVQLPADWGIVAEKLNKVYNHQGLLVATMIFTSVRLCFNIYLLNIIFNIGGVSLVYRTGFFVNF